VIDQLALIQKMFFYCFCSINSVSQLQFLKKLYFSVDLLETCSQFLTIFRNLFHKAKAQQIKVIYDQNMIDNDADKNYMLHI
jgi:hypothetical protein